MRVEHVEFAGKALLVGVLRAKCRIVGKHYLSWLEISLPII